MVEQPPHAQQPGDSAGDSTGDGATTNLKIEVDVKKEGDEDGGNDNSGPAEPSNETFGNSCGENKGSRFRCVAKLKLRVDEIEGGPKRSRVGGFCFAWEGRVEGESGFLGRVKICGALCRCSKLCGSSFLHLYIYIYFKV